LRFIAVPYYFRIALATILLVIFPLTGSPLIHDQDNLVTSQQLSDFLKSASVNNTDALKLALARGIPVDTRDSRGRTALLLATYANAIEAAKLLIEAGADVNAKDKLQDNPYLYAGAEGRLEILNMTVVAGADLKSINRYGGTALTPAAHHGHVDVVKFLLTTKIDVDQVNFLGWTALLEAVILGDGGETHQQIVKLLLEAGADKDITDSEAVSALQHAKSRAYSEIVKLLEK